MRHPVERGVRLSLVIVASAISSAMTVGIGSPLTSFAQGPQRASSTTAEVPDLNEVSVATVKGTDQSVGTLRDGDTVFLSVADVARVLDWKIREVHPGKMLAFCRQGNEEVCVPLRLDMVDKKQVADQWYVAAEDLTFALGFSIQTNADHVVIDKQPITNYPDGLVVDSLTSNWKRGRGFETGQTLPDIPLIDLSGGERRFADFLGKRYILYCWASW